MSEDDAATDDDWFERALDEDDEARDRSTGEDPSSADAAATGADESPDDEPSETSDGSADASDGSSGGTGFDDADPASDELDAAFDAATQAASDGETVEDPFADETTQDSFDDGTTGELFEGEDGSEFGMNATGTAGAGQDGAGQEGGGNLFEDDFGSAFGGAGESEDFDDEEFDSEIPRIDVGIDGLDRMIRGGVPERHLMVAIGSAGTGKTTFGLQYLNDGLEDGEKGVFITLEQTHESIIDTAAEYGWDFEAYEAADELAVIDLDPIEMANSLDNIRGELPALIEEFDADRFVLDSVSLLEMMYDEQARRRTEVFDFTRSLKRAGVTTLLTSEADEDNPYASRHGIIEYLTDAVFILQYVRAETQKTRLAVEIQKIRNANHSRETKPYEITDEGISVYEQANIF